jgi:hypothetical protein
MSDHGEMTAGLGFQLQNEPALQGYTIFYDHGDPSQNNNVGAITAFFDELHRDTKLSEIDVAIIDKEGKVILLIEIEEKDDNPKKLIGDAMATLLGNGIDFKERQFSIGERATLLILAKKTGEGHEKRIQEIENGINQIITDGKLNKIKINGVRLSLFEKQDELKSMVMKYFIPPA